MRAKRRQSYGERNRRRNLGQANGTPWTDGCWVGYTIKKTTGFAFGQQQTFSIITANTSNEITYHQAFQPAKNLSFSKGDQFKLYKVLQAVDQPGRIGGTIT
jgi:hypothetical protein